MSVSTTTNEGKKLIFRGSFIFNTYPQLGNWPLLTRPLVY
jgi:hypothetical protein